MASGFTATSADDNGVVGISTHKTTDLGEAWREILGKGPIKFAGVYGENVTPGFGIGVAGHGTTSGVFGMGAVNGLYGIGGKDGAGVAADASQGGLAASFGGDVLVDGNFRAAQDGLAASFGGDVLVDGNFRAAQGGLAASFQGNIQVTGDVKVTGDVILTNADCAEDFDVAPEAAAEPGTVMILDDEGSLTESNRPYDKRVAGVIAGAGDCKPAITLGRQAAKTKREPLSLIGRVYCKVDAGYAPIKVGDLLTTSATPGHAMKAVEPAEAFGAVIGKALRSIASGTGLIPILIALQ